MRTLQTDFLPDVIGRQVRKREYARALPTFGQDIGVVIVRTCSYFLIGGCRIAYHCEISYPPVSF